MCDKCLKCKYMWHTVLKEGCETIYACDYILKNHRRRPCPAGKDCTAFEERAEGAVRAWL